MEMAELSRVHDVPDEHGHFGPYGGVFVAETLVAALDELRTQYAHYRNDPEFVAESTKAKITVGYISPEEVLKLFNGMLNQPPEVEKEMVKHIKFGN